MSSSGNCAMQQVLRQRTFTGQHFGSRSQQGQSRRPFFGASVDGRGSRWLAGTAGAAKAAARCKGAERAVHAEQAGCKLEA
eukprot:5645227-Prymnesium_polylepis.1